jgi:multiple sugar transport system substrate-binding protein
MSVAACQGARTPTQPVEVATPRVTSTLGVTPAKTSSSPRPAPTAKAKPSATLEVSSEDLQGIKISLWHPWSAAVGEAWNTLVSEFNSSNEYGITVDSAYQGNYNELYEKVQAAIAAGAPPNLAVGYNYEILSWNAGGRGTVDLNTYVDDPRWGLGSQEQDDFYPPFWTQDVIDGARLGLPAQRFAQLIYYNLTWARELGFETLPGTPQQFKRQACAAAEANNRDDDPDNNGTGGWVTNTSPSAVLSWMYAFGGEVVNTAGTGYNFDTPQIQAAIAFLKDLYDSGCAWQTDGDFAEEEFANRQALFVTGSIADLPAQKKALDQAANQDDWTVIPFPSAVRQLVIDVYGPAFAMFKSSPQEQLASWVFLKWFLSAETQARWIAAGHTYPLQASTTQLLKDFANTHPQWAGAQDLLPFAKTEPGFQSWSLVRWAVGDVGTQTFRSYFTPDRIPATVELLDKTAAELHQRFKP